MKIRYNKYVQNKSLWAYNRGLISRWIWNKIYSYSRYIGRKNGATIGVGVIIPLKLAKKLNANCIIGNHVSIETSLIDVRSGFKIGNNVIIGSGSQIITTSHNIDSTEWEHKYYGIEIEDYVWIPTNVLVLPSCRKISYGAVVGSGSVVVKDVGTMSVVSGNPAVEFKKRRCVHSDLIVESLLHGDYYQYKETRKKKL